MASAQNITMQENVPSRGYFQVSWQGFWEFWKSIKVTIAFFVILAVGCVLGTLIPQNADPQLYMEKYGPGMSYLFTLTGLTDIYHAGWFTVLLVMLGVSTVVCATHRYKVLKRFLKKQGVIKEDSFYAHRERSLKTYATVPVDKAAQTTRQLLKKNHYGITEEKDENGVYITAQKGVSNRWGNLLLHFSIVAIMIGTIFGSIKVSTMLSKYFVTGPLKGWTTSTDGQYAFNEHVQINEGQTVSIPHSDFQLRLNKFELEMQKDGRMPKDFRSFVTLIKDGKELSNHLVRVNQPLKFEGVTFFQSSYGQGEGLNKLKMQIVDSASKSELATMDVSIGEMTKVPGKEESFRIAQFLPDFAMDPKMQPFSKSNEMNNPAVQIEEYKNGVMTGKSWIFAKFEDFHASGNTSFSYKVKEILPSAYSVFQTVKDPGIPIVYLGFLGLILGTVFSLMIDHKRVWVKISANEKGSLIRMTGHANRRTDHKVMEMNSIIDHFNQEETAKA